MRILIIENGFRDLVNSRFPLGDYFIKKGHCVKYACPNPDKKSEVYELRASRNSFSPFLLIGSIMKLKKIEIENKIDTVLSFRLTSNILNYLASFFGEKKHRVAIITGLGYAFVYPNFKYKLLKFIISYFYKFAERRLIIISQNPNDSLDLGLKKCNFVLGSGIKDPEKSIFIKNNEEKNLNLLFVARLLKSKGIEQTIAIYKEVRKKHKTAKLIIAGSIDVNNPDSISNEYLLKIKNINGVEFLNYVDNIQEIYLKCNVLIFLSIYREGVPRAIIEAMSYGLTIITTDMPGCRETISDNGILIKNNFTEESIGYLDSLSSQDLIDNKLNSIKMFRDKFSQTAIFPQYYNIISQKK